MKCMCYSPLGQRWERVQHPVSLVEKTNFKSGGTCMEPPPRRQEAEEAVGGMGGVPPQCWMHCQWALCAAGSCGWSWHSFQITQWFHCWRCFFYGVSVEAVHDGCWSSCCLTFAEEVEPLQSFLGRWDGVCPGGVLHDVHIQTFGAVPLLRGSTVDGQWEGELGVRCPEVN